MKIKTTPTGFNSAGRVKNTNKKLAIKIIVIAMAIGLITSIFMLLGTAVAQTNEKRTVYLGQLIGTSINNYFYFHGITFYNNEYTLAIGHRYSDGGSDIYVHVKKGENLHLYVWELTIVDFDKNGDWLTFTVR